MKPLLQLAELPRSTFYYYLRQLKKPEKYQMVKESIVTIFHENKKKYGYRRITQELHKNVFFVNHKTVQKLMRQLGLVCQARARKKYNSYKAKVNSERLLRTFWNAGSKQTSPTASGSQM